MSQLIECNRVAVLPWNCDQFGHMNVRYYAHHFDDASFTIWSIMGVRMNEYLDKGVHTVVAKTETNFIKETKAGETLLLKGGFTRVGTKSVTMHFRMFDSDTLELCATYESIEVFFDAQTRKAREIPAEIKTALEKNIVTLDDEN